MTPDDWKMLVGDVLQIALIVAIFKAVRVFGAYKDAIEHVHESNRAVHRQACELLDHALRIRTANQPPPDEEEVA